MAVASGGMMVPRAKGDVVLGEDWTDPVAARDRSGERASRRMITLNSSPLARKIVTFNLLALVVLVAGVLYLNPFRDSLVLQREQGLVTEAELTAAVIEARAGEGAALSGEAILDGLVLPARVEVFVFGTDGTLAASSVGRVMDRVPPAADLADNPRRRTIIIDFLGRIWEAFEGDDRGAPRSALADQASALVPQAVSAGASVVDTGRDIDGGTVFAVATPIESGGETVGVLAFLAAGGQIDALVRDEREQVLQMFIVAILVSIGLSLVLASTIANPLHDLASAAEVRQDAGSKAPARVRIPDLTARPDEIGRLSGALRGMVGALYDRIDANEQFAADVAHEIKNPLASLRSAVGTLHVASTDEQRAKLLSVIEHDVRRLDRLVSDISNASRLDAELVKEEEEPFDLMTMMGMLCEHLGQQAGEKGIEFITDLPPEPVTIRGLEPRLAQVFVNLITNAASFCGEGDAIRVWARSRENRVLVVVEDTGPGIPDEALGKIFNRFYSERPEGQFGDNSGLGLAISKQIVEAHGGVIWAENIRPPEADVTSKPVGARFVVGLPV